MVTFGCPYPGNRAFAQDYQALVRDSWHVVEERDPVPRAGKFWGLFKRPGHRVLINRRGELVVRPNALELQVPARPPGLWSANVSNAMQFRLAFCMKSMRPGRMQASAALRAGVSQPYCIPSLPASVQSAGTAASVHMLP